MSEELGCKAYPPITESLSQRIIRFAEDLEQEQIENERLHNENDALRAERDLLKRKLEMAREGMKNANRYCDPEGLIFHIIDNTLAALDGKEKIK
jgi:cell division protein FtsB